MNKCESRTHACVFTLYTHVPYVSRRKVSQSKLCDLSRFAPHKKKQTTNLSRHSRANKFNFSIYLFVCTETIFYKMKDNFVVKRHRKVLSQKHYRQVLKSKKYAEQENDLRYLFHHSDADKCKYVFARFIV